MTQRHTRAWLLATVFLVVLGALGCSARHRADDSDDCEAVCFAMEPAIPYPAEETAPAVVRLPIAPGCQAFGVGGACPPGFRCVDDPADGYLFGVTGVCMREAESVADVRLEADLRRPPPGRHDVTLRLEVNGEPWPTADGPLGQVSVTPAEGGWNRVLSLPWDTDAIQLRLDPGRYDLGFRIRADLPNVRHPAGARLGRLVVRDAGEAAVSFDSVGVRIGPWPTDPEAPVPSRIEAYLVGAAGATGGVAAEPPFDGSGPTGPIMAEPYRGVIRVFLDGDRMSFLEREIVSAGEPPGTVWTLDPIVPSALVTGRVTATGWRHPFDMTVIAPGMRKTHRHEGVESTFRFHGPPGEVADVVAEFGGGGDGPQLVARTTLPDPVDVEIIVPTSVRVAGHIRGVDPATVRAELSLPGVRHADVSAAAPLGEPLNGVVGGRYDIGLRGIGEGGGWRIAGVVEDWRMGAERAVIEASATLHPWTVTPIWGAHGDAVEDAVAGERLRLTLIDPDDPQNRPEVTYRDGVFTGVAPAGRYEMVLAPVPLTVPWREDPAGRAELGVLEIPEADASRPVRQTVAIEAVRLTLEITLDGGAFPEVPEGASRGVVDVSQGTSENPIPAAKSYIGATPPEGTVSFLLFPGVYSFAYSCQRHSECDADALGVSRWVVLFDALELGR